jgi:hypothetical protein
MKSLVPILAFLMASGACAQTAWRQSDTLGNDLGSVESKSHQKGWILRVEFRGQGEERTLFHDGREDSVRLVERDPSGRVVRIHDSRGGQAVGEVIYDPGTGLPATEISFRDNQPSETAQLEFEHRLLVRRTVRDGHGDLLYTDRLAHWPDGTLRRLERDGPSGALAEVAWSYGAGGLAGAWAADPEEREKGEHKEWVYSANRTEETLVSGASLVSTKVTERLDSGASREVQTDFLSSQVEKRLQDPQGRTVEDVVLVKGKVTEVSHWSYDSQGRLIESSVDSEGSRETWSYAYRNDGTTISRLARDGVLVREEILRDGEKVSVSVYDRGELFLVETWTGGKKVKESYYSKGSIVRERTP